MHKLRKEISEVGDSLVTEINSQLLSPKKPSLNLATVANFHRELLPRKIRGSRVKIFIILREAIACSQYYSQVTDSNRLNTFKPFRVLYKVALKQSGFKPNFSIKKENHTKQNQKYQQQKHLNKETKNIWNLQVLGKTPDDQLLAYKVVAVAKDRECQHLLPPG